MQVCVCKLKRDELRPYVGAISIAVHPSMFDKVSDH